MRKIEISIVIPVYKSQEILKETVNRTIAALKKFKFKGFEIILIDDRSPDSSWKVITEICQEYPSVSGYRMLKNYGQHTAVHCGFKKATGEYVVTMDDDLQNPPEEIIKLWEKAREGYDLVFGKFRVKQHSLSRKIGSKLVGYLNSKIFSKPEGIVLSNFRIIRKDLIERILGYKTNYPYIPGLALMFAENIANVDVEHHPRVSGKSNYNLWKIFELMGRILFNYSAYPLKVVSGVGVFISVGAFLVGVFYLFHAYFFGVKVPGWTTVVILLSFLQGTVLLILGMIGEYLSRLITDNSYLERYYVISELNSK